MKQRATVKQGNIIMDLLIAVENQFPAKANHASTPFGVLDIIEKASIVRCHMVKREAIRIQKQFLSKGFQKMDMDILIDFLRNHQPM